MGGRIMTDLDDVLEGTMSDAYGMQIIANATAEVAQLRTDKQFLSTQVAKYISRAARWREFGRKAHLELVDLRKELKELRGEKNGRN
jgi:hypothetical protein